MISPEGYGDLARAVIARTSIADRLRERSAVVLERVARGGGEVRWYWCPTAEALDSIPRRLRPGSSVSFYFDGRIHDSACSPDLLSILGAALPLDSEIVLGALGEDGVTIEVELPTSPNEVREVVAGFDPSVRVFYGLFPGRDNDGVDAITIDLPDTDGVLRAHPH